MSEYLENELQQAKKKNAGALPFFLMIGGIVVILVIIKLVMTHMG